MSIAVLLKSLTSNISQWLLAFLLRSVKKDLFLSKREFNWQKMCMITWITA